MASSQAASSRSFSRLSLLACVELLTFYNHHDQPSTHHTPQHTACAPFPSLVEPLGGSVGCRSQGKRKASPKTNEEFEEAYFTQRSSTPPPTTTTTTTRTSLTPFPSIPTTTNSAVSFRDLTGLALFRRHQQQQHAQA